MHSRAGGVGRCVVGSDPMVGGEGADHQATNLIRYDLNKCWSGIRCPLCALGGRQLGYLWWGQIGFRTPELHFLIHGKYETLFNSAK